MGKFGVGLLSLSILSLTTPLAQATHRYLVDHKLLSGVQKISSLQEIYDIQENYRDEEEYVQNHSLWIQSVKESFGAQTEQHTTPQRTVDAASNLISVTPSRSGKPMVSLHIVDSDDHYTLHKSFEAEFVEGNWSDYQSKKPYLLRLTAQGQSNFNEYMKERIELTFMHQLKMDRRPAFLRQGRYIKAIRILDKHILNNPSIDSYLSRRPHRLDLQGYTYFFGSETGMIVTHPDMTIHYEIEFCHSSPACEMKWKDPGTYRVVDHLVSIDLST